MERGCQADRQWGAAERDKKSLDPSQGLARLLQAIASGAYGLVEGSCLAHTWRS
jgi:hypothetical protein